VAGAAYAMKDVYTSGNIAYVAITDHVATTVAADLAAGKISVLQGITRQDLATIAGAGMVGTQAPGAGAAPRTQAQKNADIVTPADYGAAGDGVTNDTAKFAALEVAVQGRPVDLQGKSYVVDQQPTGNAYFNGFFKRSSDGHVFVAGRNPNNANCGAEITLKSKANDARYQVPPGLAGAIVVLGDSISHGAFQGNLYQDGWVNVLKRMLNAETGSKGYGFAPLLTLGAGATLTQEVHDVNFAGAWAPAESTTGGGDILQGLSYTSSTVGDSITITVPTFQRMVRVWYVAKPGGGVFSIAANGGAAQNVDTNAAARDQSKSILVPMNDNGAGKYSVRLAVVSGSVTLCGIGYETPPVEADTKAGNVVQNFSQSGRRLQPATEDMIDLACRGSVLILALGYNDSGDVEADANYNTAFQQRIDWIIKYCLKYNTTLVVVDMCWWATPANKARRGLRRAATEARGIYIPLTDYLTRDQLVQTEYGSSYYMVDTLLKWQDGAHPNVAGAKWIAEAVAKAMGLSCTSKEQALAFHDFPWPLQLDPNSIFKNTFGQMPYLSTIHRSGNVLTISMRLTTKLGGAIPAGLDYSVNLGTTKANSRQVQYFNTSAIDYYAPLNLNNLGAISTAFKMGLANDIQIASFAPFLNSFSFGFTVPCDTTATRA